MILSNFNKTLTLHEVIKLNKGCIFVKAITLKIKLYNMTYSITLEATNPKSKKLAKLLKLNNVKIDNINLSGYPEITLSGSKANLFNVLISEEGWDDGDLINLAYIN